MRDVAKDIYPLNFRKDSDEFLNLVEICFSEELERKGGDLREEITSIRKLLPLISILGIFSRRFRHLLDGFFWKDDGQMRGLVTATALTGDLKRWEIGTVATHPDYRRQGIARKLVKTAIEHAQGLGAEICILDVRSDNIPAYDLYRSLGFTHYDSETELKLEKLPEVKKLDFPSKYHVFMMNLRTGKARYDLALRETPQEVVEFVPVEKDQFQTPFLARLLYPFIIRLQRIHYYRWGVDYRNQLVGTIRLGAYLRSNTVHSLRINIDPTYCEELAELLVSLALHTLQRSEYPRQNTLVPVRTSNKFLLELLKSFGFVEIENNHKLALKL